MNLGVNGKVAVVTGGSRGLGMATARTLVDEGCRVAILARDGEACRRAVDDLSQGGGEVMSVTCDLADLHQVRSAFGQVRDRMGPPQILIYNNSGAPDAFWDKATDDDFDEAYTLLVKALAWCVREVEAGMRSAGWGRIVTLGSICAREPHRAPLPMILHNVARPAQVGLNKTLATELAPYGITVNTIGIGAFDHDGTARSRAYEQLTQSGVSSEDRSVARLASIPVGRYGRADELASLCAFVCSDRAGFITGQTLFIDGGGSRNLF